MSNRGIISFKLGGTEFDLVPSLENLDNLETATNKPIYMVASNPKLSDSIKDSVISGTIINCKLLSNTGEVYSGGFLITSFESSGEFNKAELVAITLESSWTISLIDNDFRLLEGGGFRLLEDGSRRMLEAA